jgi:hypothetical protein
MYIELNNGTVVQVDECDLDLLANDVWYTNQRDYVIRDAGPRHNRQRERLHRVIMARVLGRELMRHELVDHINLNPLDNRRSNLRLCNNSQNQFNRDLPAHNTTGYKGVYRNSPGNLKPWQAAITINYRKRYLGSFMTAVEAALAYDRAALELAGEFANGNLL